MALNAAPGSVVLIRDAEWLVTKVEQGRKLIFKVEMRKSDVGKVIGRSGHTITAMRNVMNAAASRSGQQVLLQIVE